MESTDFECKKLRCKIFGHTWMTYLYKGQETAILRQVHRNITMWATGNLPDMVQLRCNRSGAWIAVDSLELKKYLSKTPDADEVDRQKLDEALENAGVMMLEE